MIQLFCPGLSDDKRVLTTRSDEGRKYHPDVDTEIEDSSLDRSVIVLLKTVPPGTVGRLA